ncbi:MaoC family dehydratase [Halalkalibacter lacteus]|uniref:MaoC family dehydratase n=1 Tax=Halalkalibacter lacteus TaxID=3090663 RepID=UPI002FCAC84A
MDRLVLPTIYISKIKEEHIATYGEVSNDFNPLHFDKKAAKQAGFSDRIVHGMMTMGISTKLISPWLSSDCFIKEYESSFRYPLLIGDSLHIYGEIAERTCFDARITFKGINQHSQIIITGKILVEGRLQDSPSLLKPPSST